MDMGWGFSMRRSLARLFYVKLWFVIKVKWALFASNLGRDCRRTRVFCANLFYWHAAAGEHAAQISDRREHFVIPVCALELVSALFVFHDVLVLAENILREPSDEGPYHVNDAGETGLLDRQISVGAIGPLPGVERRVPQPDIENRIIGLLDVASDPNLEALRRIIGADAHMIREVLLGFAALAHEIDNDLLAYRRLSLGAAEAVLDFSPVLAMISSEAAGPYGSHLFAVHELMVHVEKIFVHERIVTGDFAIEPASLVVPALR